MKLEKNVRTLCVALSFALAIGAVAAPALAGSMDGEKTVMVGGAAMYPSRNIIQNAVNSKDHTTLVAAVKAAGLVDTLSGPGPFTVFAPTNEAFAALPAGTVDTLVKPENKATLTKILTYHVLAGRYTSKDLADAVAKGHGTATMKTVEGDPLTFKQDGAKLEVIDSKGNAADVTIADVMQSNGVIHVVDKVLMP
jgi:uncharacterized surface protein with fasciclin (FAS1) repeats